MKIRFHGVGCVPMEQMARNVEACHALGIPDVGDAKRTRLAVVGGGHSLLSHLDELRNFDGDLWIVAGAHRWCAWHGIKGWFFAIGPELVIAELAHDVTHAVLSSCVDPSVFEAVKGAQIRVLNLTSSGDMIDHGPSTVTAGFVHAIRAGYREVTFYGCDSSYQEGWNSHAYENAPHPYRINVQCNGERFHTEALLLLQAEYMATMIRHAPNVFKEKSGGLLRAMVADPEYDVTHRSQELIDYQEAA